MCVGPSGEGKETVIKTDLGERPSCLLVLDSDEDADFMQIRFFLPNLRKPLFRWNHISLALMTMLWEAKLYRRIPKTRHCFCNFCLDYSLFPFTFGQVWLTRALDCKYHNSYSTVGSKPLLGCFTRMFIVSAISNARDYRSSTVSTAFWKQEGFWFQK